jgi:hypothetical protein
MKELHETAKSAEREMMWFNLQWGLTYSNWEDYHKVNKRYEQLYEFFITPTIKYTYDKSLFGHYCVDVIWLRWGFTVSWGHKK